MNMKNIYKYIIFTIVVWLIFFIPCTMALSVSNFGVYDGGGSYARWTNTSVPAMASCYGSTDFFYKHYGGHTISIIINHNSTPPIKISGVDSFTGSYYGETGTIAISATSPYSFRIYSGGLYDMIAPSTSYPTGYFNIYNRKSIFHFYPIDADTYTITGQTCGIYDVSLYINDILILNKQTNMTIDTYSFNIVNQTNYKIVFSDGHEYEFTCTDNEIYNRDLCDYQILHYVDDCGNFLKNPTINIIKNDNYANPLISEGDSHTDVFGIPDDVILGDKLDVWIGTDQGEQFRTIYVENGEDYLYHSFKSWDLDVTVYDINTTAYISGAKVSVKQDCRINAYSLHTFGTTNMYGYVKTYDLSNQAYQVKVTKEGYNTFGYQTINAGFDAQHTNIPLTVYLQDTTKGDGNGSIGEPPSGGDGTGGDDEEPLPQTPCSIMWADNDGKSITEINDTQDARLYFMAPNCSATLYLESRDSNNHVWVFEASLPVTALQAGYAQYVSADWTYPETKRYRGRLWAGDCMCDATDDLKVWNASDANITIVNNLSANVHFRHKVGGTYINPATPIHISSTASSNNTSLLNINLQLFNSTVKVDEISYTFFDYYTDESFSSIQWKPNYEYSAGCLYCVYMYSNDILVNFDSVYANATDDNYFDTGNALTIKVYDQGSVPLAYSSVYIEDWGTEDTGNSNRVIFSGLGNDEYQYRAIKSGYLDRGFYAITLAGDDTVNYVLDIISTEHSVTDLRMSDHDIKTMMYPIIFFILIMLLIGVLIDAIN